MIHQWTLEIFGSDKIKTEAESLLYVLKLAHRGCKGNRSRAPLYHPVDSSAVLISVFIRFGGLYYSCVSDQSMGIFLSPLTPRFCSSYYTLLGFCAKTRRMFLVSVILVCSVGKGYLSTVGIAFPDLPATHRVCVFRTGQYIKSMVWLGLGSCSLVGSVPLLQIRRNGLVE
jgi:hypothetical protein